MKSFKAQFLLILFSALIISSCKKSSNSDTPQDPHPIKAYINNSSWFANSVTTHLYIHVDSISSYRVVSVTATNNAKTITMEFMDHSTGNSLEVGNTHSFSSEARFYYDDTGPAYSSNAGSITVTSNDPSRQIFSATFAFTAVQNNGSNIVSVQQGVLTDVSYDVINQ